MLRSDFSAGQTSYSRNPFHPFPLDPERRPSQHPPPIEAFFDANKHPDERISSS
jgi:hypothetical protein